MQQRSRPTVMIVDDAPASLQLLFHLLDKQGYRIAAFTDASEALAAAEKAPPDLIMMDIRMPGLDGLEACRRLKAHARLGDIPVLFISMLDEPERIVQAFAAGGADYVIKPFQPEVVLARVNAHLRLRSLFLESRQCRLELEQADIEKEKIRSLILHDIKEPMSLLTIAAGMLADPEESLSGQDIHDVAGQIQTGLKRVHALLDDLVQCARIGQAGIECAPKTLSLRALVECCLRTLLPTALKKDIRIDANIAPDVLVRADPDMIDTVLRNLILNAVKYSRRGAGVTVSSERDADMVRIAVRDEGMGMDQAMLDKVFTISKDKLQLGSEGERGVGLGLLLCKRFVQRHGGRIWLESQRWQGTTAFLTLPAADSESA